MEETESALCRAEELIERGEIEQAQELLNSVKGKNARKCYLQSKLFIKKSWHNEARKQLEKAMRLDPENEEYKIAYEELTKGNDSQLPEWKKKKFDRDGCAECCFVASCELCGTGLCGAICDGC